VYVFGAAGAAARVPGAPQWITPAGFAPQHVGGPYLALSNDGAQAAWCTDGLSWEAWIADVLPTSPPPSQLSADGVFLDTLDGVGPFWFRADGRLQFAIGEKADPLVGGVEGLDVYEAFLPVGGAPLIANLTQTNGSAAPPYLQKSTIDPNFLRRVPGSDELLLQGRVGQQDVLARLGSAGVQPLILDVKKTQAVEYSGTAFLLGLESGAGAQPTLVVSLATSGAGAWIPGIVAALPTGTVVERTATNGLGTVAAVIDWLADEWVAAIDASTGAAALLFQFPLTYGPALDLGSTGGVALSTGPIGAPALSGTWTPGGSALAFQTPFAACQVLPGR
jgi:hypothetical protein